MKTVKNASNDNIRSVAARHPKTTSNLLKPITESDIITQELETVKNKTFLI